MSTQLGATIAVAAAALTLFPADAAAGENATQAIPSKGIYRLPFANGTAVKVFDDFTSHRPVGRIDFYATDGTPPFKVVAAADGRIVAIQDGYSEQQSGRAAKDCHNNYVWIAHPNGEWTNYSHLAHGTVTGKARLTVGDTVRAGTYLGDEGAVGCAMLNHVHFEVVVPPKDHPLDPGGFLMDNENGIRERQPRFCDVPGQTARKDALYKAAPCR